MFFSVLKRLHITDLHVLNTYMVNNNDHKYFSFKVITNITKFFSVLKCSLIPTIN